MTKQEKLVADLGKPKLGEKSTIRIRIRESKEFKVTKNKKRFSLFVFVFCLYSTNFSYNFLLSN